MGVKIQPVLTPVRMHTFFHDPDHIIHWSIRAHPLPAPRIRALSEQHPELPIVWLRTTRDVNRGLSRLARTPSG